MKKIGLVAVTSALIVNISFAKSLEVTDVSDADRVRICTGSIKSADEANVAIKVCDTEGLSKVNARIQVLKRQITEVQGQIDKYESSLTTNAAKGYLKLNLSKSGMRTLSGVLAVLATATGITAFISTHPNFISNPKTPTDIKITNTLFKIEVITFALAGGIYAFSYFDDYARAELSVSSDQVSALKETLSILQDELRVRSSVVQSTIRLQ